MKNQIQIGEIQDTELRGHRDALHQPVIVVEAHRRLVGGEKIGVAGDVSSDDVIVGVVDPFLSFVDEGECFHIFLRPGAAGEVKHVWEFQVEGVKPGKS